MTLTRMQNGELLSTARLIQVDDMGLERTRKVDAVHVISVSNYIPSSQPSHIFFLCNSHTRHLPFEECDDGWWIYWRHSLCGNKMSFRALQDFFSVSIIAPFLSSTVSHCQVL